MIELNLENKKGKIKINSSDVKNILRLRPDFEYIQDISETINQENIMVYDCQLSRDVFNMEDIDEIKEDVVKLGGECAELGLRDKAILIMNKALGTDSEGVQRTLDEAIQDNAEALELCIEEMKDLIKENR